MSGRLKDGTLSDMDLDKRVRSRRFNPGDSTPTGSEHTPKHVEADIRYFRAWLTCKIEGAVLHCTALPSADQNALASCQFGNRASLQLFPLHWAIVCWHTQHGPLLPRGGSVWGPACRSAVQAAWGRSLEAGMHNPCMCVPYMCLSPSKTTPFLLCSPQGPDEDDEEGSLETRMRSPWWQRTRLITTVLINLGNIMERADEQILPAGEVRDAQSLRPCQSSFSSLQLCSPETQQGGPLAATPQLQAHGLQGRQQQSHNLPHGLADCASWWAS